MTTHTRGALAICAVAAGITAPLHLAPPTVTQLTLVMVYAIAVLGLNLLTGYAGHISLAQGAFFALGAYTTAVLVTDANWPHLLTIPPAALLGYTGGTLLGLPALRLRGLYLALVTLALAVLVPQLIKAADPLTHGSLGITFTPLTAPAWTGLADDQFAYYTCAVIAAAAFAFATRLTQGRTGRALIAVRDHEIAATAHGINTARVKTTAFATSAAYAATAGALYATTLGFVAPEAFTLQLSFLLATAGFIGGLRTIPGALLGAAFIILIPEYATEVDEHLTTLIFGTALLACLYLLPHGLWSLTGRLRPRRQRMRHPSPARGSADALVSEQPAAPAAGEEPGAALDAPPTRR